MKTIKFLFLLSYLCVACNPEKIDTKRVKKEMEGRKIKRISEGEIIQAADSTGNALTSSIQMIISKNLDGSLNKDKGAIETALPFCILSKYPEIDSIAYTFQVKISRNSASPINPDNRPAAHAKELIEAYAYSSEQKLALSSSTEILQDKILFYKPIMASEQFCLKCHGTPGKDLTEEEYHKIVSKYPTYKPGKVALNEFMGVWSLEFDKKEFIKQMR